MEFDKLDNIKENNVYCICDSDIINKIEFCKSYNPHIIEVNCECLKELQNDNFKIKPKIVINLDNLGEDLNYVLENIELYKKSAEKLFELKDNFLDELFFQTLFRVLDWWDNDKDEKGNIIDIEYIKKCLERVTIEIQSFDGEIFLYVNYVIEGLNGEDFLAGHMLDAFIHGKDNYKIEFHVS